MQGITETNKYNIGSLANGDCAWYDGTSICEFADKHQLDYCWGKLDSKEMIESDKDWQRTVLFELFNSNPTTDKDAIFDMIHEYYKDRLVHELGYFDYSIYNALICREKEIVIE